MLLSIGASLVFSGKALVGRGWEHVAVPFFCYGAARTLATSGPGEAGFRITCFCWSCPDGIDKVRLRMARKKSKAKSKAHTVIVPLYPFDPENNETAILNENEVILTSHCLAHRVRQIVLIGADSRYHFTDDDSDMNRFKHLFRRLIIDKNIYTWDEARPTDFFQLMGRLKCEVKREEDRINSQWKEGLRDILSIARPRLCKEHWRSRVREAVGRIEKYVAALHKGESAGQSPIPRICFDGFHRYRLPSGDDLPWMYWVLGWGIECVFGIDDVFIPKDVEERVQTLRKTAGDIDYENCVFERVCFASLDDFRNYWSFVQADLNLYLKHEHREADFESRQESKDESMISPKQITKEFGGTVELTVKNTPETDQGLIYQVEAATFYNIPKSTLSKAAKRKPGEVGYMWSGHKGRRVFYRRIDCAKLGRSRGKLG